MRLRNYSFKASGVVKDPEKAAAIMIESLNKGPESIIQHRCPKGVIVADEDTVDGLSFVMDGDNLSGIRVDTHDWLIKGWKNEIRESLQIAADKAGRETGSSISVDSNMKYEGTDENLPKFFYHLTEKKSLDGILENGLTPKRGHNDWKSKKRCTYLTEGAYIVPWLGILDHMDNPVVLEVAANKLPFVEQGRIWTDRDYVPGRVYSEHRTTETIPADAIRVMEPEEIRELGVNEKAVDQLLCVAGQPCNTRNAFTKEWIRSGESEVKLCVRRLHEMGVMDGQTYADAMRQYDEIAESVDFAAEITHMNPENAEIKK